jgi:hypothetical protein
MLLAALIADDLATSLFTSPTTRRPLLVVTPAAVLLAALVIRSSVRSGLYLCGASSAKRLSQAFILSGPGGQGDRIKSWIISIT